MWLCGASSRLWCVVVLTDGETGVGSEGLTSHGVVAMEVAGGSHGGEEEEGEGCFRRQHLDRCQVDVAVLKSGTVVSDSCQWWAFADGVSPLC